MRADRAACAAPWRSSNFCCSSTPRPRSARSSAPCRSRNRPPTSWCARSRIPAISSRAARRRASSSAGSCSSSAWPIAPRSICCATAARSSRSCANECGETVQLSVLENDMMLVLLKEEGSHPVRIISRVGSRVPVNWAASGRLLVSDLDDNALTSLLSKSVRQSPTGRATVEIDKFIQQVRKARKQGFFSRIERDQRACGLRRRTGDRRQRPLRRRDQHRGARAPADQDQPRGADARRCARRPRSCRSGSGRIETRASASPTPRTRVCS